MKLWLTAAMQRYGELLRYLGCGVLTTAVNWLTYAILVTYTAATLPVANGCAWMVAVYAAFVSNKLWVFTGTDWTAAALLREVPPFVAARLLSGVLEIFGLPLLLNLGLNQPLFHIEGFLAKVSISGIVILINYVLSKYVVFRHK